MARAIIDENGDTLCQVDVPEGTRPGDSIQILFSPQAEGIRTEARTRVRSTQRSLRWTIKFWIVLEVIITVLLVLPLVLNRYAIIRFRSCDTEYSTLYLSFLNGLSSQSHICQRTAGEFCLSWGQASSWDFFARQAGVQSINYYTDVDITSMIKASQVLLSIGLGFTLLSLLTHFLILCNTLGWLSFMLAPYMILIAFVTTIASISNFTLSPPAQALFWLNYLRSGATIQMLLQGESGSEDSTNLESTTCSVQLWYEGGVLHSLAVALLFPLLIWTLFNSCTYSGKIFRQEEEGDHGSSPRGQRPRASSSITML